MKVSRSEADVGDESQGKHQIEINTNAMVKYFVSIIRYAHRGFHVDFILFFVYSYV